MTLEEKRRELTAAHRLIRAKYKAGVSLFTKDLFRDLVHQFESSDKQTVSVTGLDGLAVQFRIETGTEHPSHPFGDDYRCIHTEPRLVYHAIGNLLATEDPTYFSVSRAYLPVEVAHSTEIRNAETNELVDLWPASDYATAKKRFEKAQRLIEASEPFTQLKSTLASVAIPARIDKIVAFACSTITWVDDDYAMPNIAQHILALTIRDVLGASDCYAQDPIYTPVDRRVLSEAGFIVVDDPRAFLQVDEASVVIAVGPDIPLKQIVADIARPAIMIWDKFDASDTDSADPVSLRVEQMLKEYIELPFPAEREYFGDLAIYIRKED